MNTISNITTPAPPNNGSTIHIREFSIAFCFVVGLVSSMIPGFIATEKLDGAIPTNVIFMKTHTLTYIHTYTCIHILNSQ